MGARSRGEAATPAHVIQAGRDDRAVVKRGRNIELATKCPNGRPRGRRVDEREVGRTAEGGGPDTHVAFDRKQDADGLRLSRCGAAPALKRDAGAHRPLPRVNRQWAVAAAKWLAPRGIGRG